MGKKRVRFFWVLLAPLGLFAEMQGLREAPAQVLERVEVKPAARDGDIQRRLENILKATGSFAEVQVQVKDGVVFLSAQTKTQEFKDWAGGMARNTQNVVAVINNIEVTGPFLGGFPALEQTMRQFGWGLVQTLPSLLKGSIILLALWALASWSRYLMQRKITNLLARNLLIRSTTVCIFLWALYLLCGGRIFFIMLGLGGLLSIVFRELTESFFATILLSIHNSFKEGDLIEVNGLTGYVEGVTMRVTILRGLQGSYIEIPNAIVYKSSLVLFPQGVPLKGKTQKSAAKATKSSKGQSDLEENFSKQNFQIEEVAIAVETGESLLQGRDKDPTEA